jgi:diguanylate cyclase (GGDEF)-like protein
MRRAHSIRTTAVRPSSHRDPGGRPRGGFDGLPDRLLGDVTQLLVSEGSPERVLEALADALRQIVPHDTLTVYQADLSLRVLRPVLVRDTWAQEILAMGPIMFGEGITGAAAELGQPLLIEDGMADARAQQIVGTPVEHESLIVIPLLARDELKGVLCLYRLGEGNRFSEDEFRLGIRFAAVAALAIDNAQIRARLEAELGTDHLTALHNHRHFHERLAEELRYAVGRRMPVSLVLFDIDDFARVNASYGHLLGDQVLQSVASAIREIAGPELIPCRIGGEEFALILPRRSVEEAHAVAEHLRQAVAAITIPEVDHVTVSAGVAEGPLHATGSRELTACADAALRRAKAEGKDRVVVFDDRQTRSPAGPTVAEADRDVGRRRRPPPFDRPDLADVELRSLAHLKMLQSLSTKLNRLNDTERIGATITAELRSLIDYHNCRVHLLSPDEKTLVPIAFRGELIEYEGETFDALVSQVGEGITGRVGETGESLYIPNAADCEFSVQIPGTIDVDESMLVVPLIYGDRVTGTITLSKLGIDQFEQGDLRILEVLANHAAVAFENARLYQVERESAEISGALLALSQALTTVGDADTVLDRALEAIPSLIAASAMAAWIRDPDSGDIRMVNQRGFQDIYSGEVPELAVLPAVVADPFALSEELPFVLPRDVIATVPDEFRWMDEPRALLVAPLRWEPDGRGSIVAAAATPTSVFSDRDLRLMRGLADITSLALGNANRFDELERAYLSTIEALANALEAQDEYTSDHARALAEMTLAVGSHMGLRGEDLKRLEIAALFHDIGKIGVPSEIIRKPGPLTAQERRVMNMHPEIGEQILAPVPFLSPIRPVIRACHERWDGKGYPDGLKGKAIPLEARIIFVCDAFHAMTTDRPYRAALPEGEAIRRLKLSAGTQFDPKVVAAFVRLHGQAGIVYHRHARP